MRIFGKDLPFYCYDEYNKIVEGELTKYYLEVENRRVVNIEFTYEDELTFECVVDFEDNHQTTYANTINKSDVIRWLNSKKRNERIDMLLG